MKTMTARIWMRHDLSWQFHGDKPWDDETGLQVYFPLPGAETERQALRRIETALQSNDISWLRRNGDVWALDLNAVREFAATFPGNVHKVLSETEWLDGIALVKPVVHYPVAKPSEVFGSIDETTNVTFTVYEEEYKMNSRTRLFLSHKGANKAFVRRFYDILTTLGFAPWLDEEDMPAGTELHRGIREGFRDSAAAVFFVTPEFKEETFIWNEINYAMEEKTAHGDRFAIVTLVFTDRDGNKGTIPELLTTFVYKEPATELEALKEILRAIPLQVGPVNWREGL